MESIGHLVRALYRDKKELMRFLRDTPAWIERQEPPLIEAEREELERVAQDAMAFFELRSREHLENSSEMAFMEGKQIGRRHLVIRAASTMLALPFAALVVGTRPARGAQGSRSDPAAESTDNVCENHTDCTDSSACLDTECVNSRTCLDKNGCMDDTCDNTTCNDATAGKSSGCSDSTCANLQCTDGDKNICLDSTCTNATCTNKWGSCLDSNCDNLVCFDDCPK